ncbi:hypothetical protein FACS1894126_0750 [Alphaproteobacteria bacterium]|nr:hypothetical protein FACS1894126_0750 [Alphaproteobacteria bacterium]
MGMGGCCNALLQCPMGVAPTPLVVLPSCMVMNSSGPMGSMPDCVPFLNIIPFGVCMSIANPATAALTAAALGILTPGPCIPTPAGVWTPMKPTVMTKLGPAVNSDSMLICAYGGVIKIAFPGQVTVLI